MRTWWRNYSKSYIVTLMVILFLLISNTSAIGLERLFSPDANQPREDSKNMIIVEKTELDENTEFEKPSTSRIASQPRAFPDNHPMNDYSDVVLIVNDNSLISKQIGDYFKANRNIPDINICNITAPAQESTTRAEFNVLRAQIESYLDENNLTNKTNYIVTTKGVPLKITHSTANRRASVDSELCLIKGPYSAYIDDNSNPKISQHVFYNKDENFSRGKFHIYLVTRLTGHDFADVKQLIDNAAASAGQRGTFWFDRDMANNKANNPWRQGNIRMATADGYLDDKGLTSWVDSNPTFRTDLTNVAGYCSWGRRDNNYYTTPVQNSGLNSPNDEGVNIPSNWFFEKTHISSVYSRNITVNRSSRFSVKIVHSQNDSGYTILSQNVTIKAGVKYYLTGYVNPDDVDNYDGGGAFLQLKAYDSGDNLVWQTNGSRRYGNTGWVAMSTIPYDTIPGVTKLRVSAVFSKANGTVYFDDIYLYEIKPRNYYVPGAIAEVYGYYTAYRIGPFAYYPFTVGDFVSDGITGIKGYVDYAGEEYIYYMAHPDILFDRYTDGYNLAESFYMASPYMSWVDIVIGDPKTTPYFDRMPDMAITEDDINFSKPNPNQGDNIEIETKIQNLGGFVISNVSVTFKIGEEFQSAKVLTTIGVSTIQAGGYSQIEPNWNTTNYHGMQTIWVHADSLNMHRETNESNNIISRQILINSNPFDIELNFSKTEIDRGNSIDIFVNLSDLETPEHELNCTLYFNNSAIQNWTPLPVSQYYSDHWQTRLETNASSFAGFYDIMLIVTDSNNASIMLIEDNQIEILNNMPELDSLAVSKNSIFRTDKLSINFTAFDFEDEITGEMLDIYSRPSVDAGRAQNDWFALPQEIIYLEEQDIWQLNFLSDITSTLGLHDLKVTITDNDGGISAIELPTAFEIFNNPPVIERVTFDTDSIFRLEYLTVRIFGGDLETPTIDMIRELEFKPELEDTSWEVMPRPPDWESESSTWVSIFYLSGDFETGKYIFRARFTDSDNAATEYVYSEHSIEILNNQPIAILRGIAKADEDEPIMFDAKDSSDKEDFKTSKYYWDFNDTTTSNESSINHAFIKAGDYNVSLTVFDNDGANGQANITVIISNQPPRAEIRIRNPTRKWIVGDEIIFDGAESYDTKSDKANLTYYWIFDDGNTSNLSRIEYKYTTPGTFQVILRVTDDNNETHEAKYFITIEPDSEIPIDEERPKKKSDLNYALTVSFLMIIILVILVLIGFAWMKKKRREHIAELDGEEKGEQKPLETVEATILDIPDFASSKTVKAGKSVKPMRAKPEVIEAKVEKTRKLKPTVSVAPAELPPASITLEPEVITEDTITPEVEAVHLPEVEVEYVPQIEVEPHSEEILPKITLPEPTTEVDEKTEGKILKLEPGLDIQLPPISPNETESMEPEVEPIVAKTTPEPVLDDIDIDFKPPKVKIPFMPKPKAPAQIHNQEIFEAQKRGEGLSFEFKKPKKK